MASQSLRSSLRARQAYRCAVTVPRKVHMSSIAAFKVPKVFNEPNHHYAKGSAQRQGLTAAIDQFQKKIPLEVPIVVGGKEIKTSSTATQHNPADHSSTVATYSKASPSDVETAIEAALAAKSEWESLPFADRAAIFLKAADLIAGKYRYEIMASTMLGQGKNAWQAEIDAAAEAADFLRFNVQYAEELYSAQPVHNSAGVWNRVEYRPLEGFVYAVTPFNFTAIAANLPGAPALMGNVVIWKPSDSAIASNWVVYNILLEAGLPKNVIQFVPGDPEDSKSSSSKHHSSTSSRRDSRRVSNIVTDIPKGRPLSVSQIVSPKPVNPQATKLILQGDYAPATVEELTSRFAHADLDDYDSYDDELSPPSSVGSSLSSRSDSSSPSSASSLSDYSTPNSETGCTCERYGITRKGERVKLDCGGARCGYSDDSSSCCSDDDDSIPTSARRQGIVIRR